MPFQVIPAVDISDKKCVRLYRGNPEYSTVFSEDPLEVSLHWEQEGASLLHVVDIDGAMTGKPVNFDIISKIIKSLSIPVQLGGGLRDTESVMKYIDAGAFRIILGTRALTDNEWLERILDAFGEKVVVGLDVKEGRLALHGWKEKLELNPFVAVGELENFGVKRIIYTDVSRDGTLQGPDYNGIESLSKSTNLRIIASGGISKVADIVKLSSLEKNGVEGVIVGMALYMNKFTLGEAIRALKSRGS